MENICRQTKKIGYQVINSEMAEILYSKFGVIYVISGVLNPFVKFVNIQRQRVDFIKK